MATSDRYSAALVRQGKRIRQRCTVPAVLLVCLGASLAAPKLAAAALDADQTESREGYFQLFWEADEPVRLVEAGTADFSDPVVLYTGADTGHVVSGKPDGVYHYRIESAADGSVLAEPVTVTVRHHSLGRALAFFALGAAVFLATLGVIFLSRPGADERA